MIFLALESYFGRSFESGCGDLGIEAMRLLGDNSISIWFMWLTLALALSGCETTLIALFRGQMAAFQLGDIEYRILPYVTAGWIWSSLMSVLTLCMFGHQPLFVTFHFVHIFAELVHLMYVMLLWHWHTSAIAVLVVACASLIATLDNSCQIASVFLSTEVVLDTLSWLVCFYVVPTKEHERAFRSLRNAFLWQLTSTYTHVLLINVVAPNSPDKATIVAWFRIYSVIATCVSVYCASIAVDEVVFGPSDRAHSCSRRILHRFFGSVLQLRCVERDSSHGTVSDLLDEPKPGRTFSADLQGMLIAFCSLCTSGAFVTHRDGTRFRRKSGPITVWDDEDLTFEFTPIVYRATIASLRRGRLIAWGMRIAIARGMFYTGVYWMIALALGMTLGLALLSILGAFVVRFVSFQQMRASSA